MGFEVVHGSPLMIWAPIVDSDVIRVGSIVACQANEGVVPIGTAGGANDTTNKLVPYGIVVGTNHTADGEENDSTNKTVQITDNSPHDSVTKRVLQEGVTGRGDRQAMVKIAIITPDTIIKGPIFNAAVGTAPTIATGTSAASSTGVALTSTTSLDSVGIAGMSTIYFRTGANAGVYRITDDTSATVMTWDKGTPNDTALGDTYVRVNLRSNGPSQVQFDAEGLYIDCSAAASTDYYGVDVIKLDLSEESKEHTYFKFNVDHFSLKRA